MALKTVCAFLLICLQAATSLECYWCSGVGQDRQCEMSPNNVSTGPVFINCKTKYCISSKVIDAATGDVKSFARLCDNIPRGNLCVRDKHLVTCFETCTKDMCNDGNPDPSYLSMQTHSNSYLGLPELGMHVRKDFALFDSAHRGHDHALNTAEPVESSELNTGPQVGTSISHTQQSMESKDLESISQNQSENDQDSKHEVENFPESKKERSNYQSSARLLLRSKPLKPNSGKTDNKDIGHRAPKKQLISGLFSFNHHANHVYSDALHLGMKPDDNKAIREHIQRYLLQKQIEEERKGKQWWEEKPEKQARVASSSLYSSLASRSQAANSRKSAPAWSQRRAQMKRTSTPSALKRKDIRKPNKKLNVPERHNFGLFRKGGNKEKFAFFTHSPGYLSSITVKPIRATTNFSKHPTNTRHPRYHASPFSSALNQQRYIPEKHDSSPTRASKQEPRIESDQQNLPSLKTGNTALRQIRNNKQSQSDSLKSSTRNVKAAKKVETGSKNDVKNSMNREITSTEPTSRSMTKQGSLRPTISIFGPTSSYHRMSQYPKNGKRFLPYKSVYMTNLVRQTDQVSNENVDSDNLDTDQSTSSENKPKTYVTKLVGRKFSGEKGRRVFKYWLKPLGGTEESRTVKPVNDNAPQAITFEGQFNPTAVSYSRKGKWWLKPTAETSKPKPVSVSSNDKISVKSFKHPRNSRLSPSFNLRRKIVSSKPTPTVEVKDNQFENNEQPSRTSVVSSTLSNTVKNNEKTKEKQSRHVGNRSIKSTSTKISHKGVNEDNSLSTDSNSNYETQKDKSDFSKQSKVSHIDHDQKPNSFNQREKNSHRSIDYVKNVAKPGKGLQSTPSKISKQSKSGTKRSETVHGRDSRRKIPNKYNSNRFEREHLVKSYRANLQPNLHTESQSKIPTQRKHENNLRPTSVLKNNSRDASHGLQGSREDTMGSHVDRSFPHDDNNKVDEEILEAPKTTAITTNGVRSYEEVKAMSKKSRDSKRHNMRQPRPSQSRTSIPKKTQNTQDETKKTVEVEGTMQNMKVGNRDHTKPVDQQKSTSNQNRDTSITSRLDNAERDEQSGQPQPKSTTSTKHISPALNEDANDGQKTFRTNGYGKTPTKAKPSSNSQKNTQAPHWIFNFPQKGVEVHKGKIMSDQMPLETHSKKIADPALQRSDDATHTGETALQGTRNIYGTSSPLRTDPVTKKYSSKSEVTTVKSESAEVLGKSFEDLHKVLTHNHKGWLTVKNSESDEGNNENVSARHDTDNVTQDQLPTAGRSTDRLSKKYPTPTIYMSRNLHRPGKSEKLEGTKRQLVYTPMMTNVSVALYSSNALAMLFLLIVNFFLV